MIKKTRYLLIVLLASLFYDAASQESQVTYYMKIPQNHFLNPAIKPANRFYIGLPVITGISAGIGEDFLKVSDIFTPGSKVNSTFFQNLDLNKLAGNLKDLNTITTDAGIQLLGLGLSFGKDLYVFFDVVDRIDVKSILPRDLMKLYLSEPSQFLEQTIDLSGMNIQGQYFREYGFGFSKNITSNLRIGLKANLLSGIGSISMNNKSLRLQVNNDGSQTVTADALMDVSGKETFQRIFTDNNIKLPTFNSDIRFKGSSSPTGNPDYKGFALDYLENPISNAGVSFDFGLVYTPFKLLTLSASVTDLGYINWKNDLKSYKANSTFHLSGITLQDVANEDFTINDMARSLADSLKSNFIENHSPQPFKTYLPTGISAGASINLLPVLSLGALSNSRVYAGTVKEAVTLSANAYLGRFLSASMSYTVANYSYDNLGFGLAIKAGIAQFYVIADKIPLSMEKVYFQKKGATDYSAITIPQSMNLLNVQLGMNIVFGKPITKKNDKPMVVVQ